MEERSLEILNDIENLASLSGKNRLDAIINHKSPLKLVNAMSGHDLLITLNEVGRSDCLELLEMLAPSQVQEMLDLETWKNDRIDIKKLGTFLCELFEANRDKALKQIYNLDIELLGLMFKISSDIYDTSLNEEPYDLPENYFLSPDRRFIVCFKSREQTKIISLALKQFLESLYERDIKFAIQLLEATRFELASSLEEDAFRWRNNRLMDLGLWPKEERRKYFSPLRKLEPKTGFDNSFKESRHFSLINLDEKRFKDFPFLNHGLKECNDQRKETIKNELILALINMHAEFSHNFGDIKEFKNTLKYIMSLVELGIMEQSQGLMSNAQLILEKNHLIDLIRIGRTLILSLKKYVVDLKKDESGILGANFSLADSPLLEVATALALKEPLFYEGLSDIKSQKSRYFSSLMEINLSLKALKELRFRAQLLGPYGLCCTDEVLISLEKDALISHSSLIARVFINGYHKKSDIFSKPKFSELQGIFENSQDGKLKNDFSIHCRKYFHNLKPKLLELSYSQNELEERIFNFCTTILTALEQNHLMLI